MHETAITKKIIDEAKKHGKVKSIVLEVGELAEIRADDLEHHLGSIVDWNVKVDGKKAEVDCSCGFKGHPKILERAHDFCIFECPSCGNAPKVIEGDKIKILEVKVE